VLAYLRGRDGFHSTSVVLVAVVTPDESPELIVPPVVAALRKPFRLRALLTLLRPPAQDRRQSRGRLWRILCHATSRGVWLHGR